jgi:hypothetical protein
MGELLEMRLSRESRVVVAGCQREEEWAPEGKRVVKDAGELIVGKFQWEEAQTPGK